MADYERELSWDEEISNESEFVTLPEGDYDFEVVKFERSRSKGSEKIPASNMAVLTIKITNGKDSATVIERLILHTKMEWKLSMFFRAIGQKKHGEPVRMNWNAVPGAKGRCKVIVSEYTTDKGEKRTKNEIDKYYDYVAPAVTSAHGWKPGDF
jgi:hypothetical protein